MNCRCFHVYSTRVLCRDKSIAPIPSTYDTFSLTAMENAGCGELVECSIQWIWIQDEFPVNRPPLQADLFFSSFDFPHRGRINGEFLLTIHA
jgi:hypothetical protein